MRNRLAGSILMLLAASIPALPQATICGIPSKYPLEKQVSASEATESYKKILEQLARVKEFGKETLCPSAGWQVSPCIRTQGNHFFYLPPFIPAPSNTGPVITEEGVPLSGEIELGWIPATEVLGGRETVERLQKAVDSSGLVSCDEEVSDCMVAVESAPSNPSEKIIAVCSATPVRGIVGALSNCEPVVIRGGGRDYVRAVVSFTGGRKSLLTYSPALELFLEGGLPSLSEALGAAQETLSGSPLALTTERRPRRNPDSVVGTAPFRLSPVLQGKWWERVKISIRLADASRTGTIDFYVDFDLVASKQNNDSGLTSPTDVQLERYKQIFSENLKSRLSNLCRSNNWKDSVTLVCNR